MKNKNSQMNVVKGTKKPSQKQGSGQKFTSTHHRYKCHCNMGLLITVFVTVLFLGWSNCTGYIFNDFKTIIWRIYTPIIALMSLSKLQPDAFSSQQQTFGIILSVYSAIILSRIGRVHLN